MKNIIKCPKCGYEYTPSEIYIPSSFLGETKYVFRNSSGIAQDMVGTEPDFKESYICDNCNVKFYVRANVKFNTSMNENEDFSVDYSSPLEKVKLFLDEG